MCAHTNTGLSHRTQLQCIAWESKNAQPSSQPSWQTIESIQPLNVIVKISFICHLLKKGGKNTHTHMHTLS